MFRIAWSRTYRSRDTTSQCIRALQGNRTNWLDGWVDGWVDGWTAERFIIGIGSCHYRNQQIPWWPSVSWQTSKAGIVNSAQVWGLESQESQWCKSQSEFEGPRTRKHWYLRADEGGCHSSSKELPFALSPAFGSMQALNGLDDAHSHWREPSFLFSLLIQISFRNTGTPRHVLAINHHAWLLRACGVQSLALKVD